MLLGMTSRYALADLAALMGEPTRAAMLLALMGGEALPASELARVAKLSAAATSLHLAKLVRGNLLAVRREGRHRYYRLAHPDVARALEGLGLLAGARAPLPALSPERAAMRAARTCYDHLAGVLAVALVDELEHARVLVPLDDYAFEVTVEGRRWFASKLDIDVSTLADGRRAFARRCLDWTERRPHIAGALGAAVLTHCLERRWLLRVRGSRALRVTTRGEAALHGLGLRLPPP
jgi:DNA-binding transcriptional ArsR family regulator